MGSRTTSITYLTSNCDKPVVEYLIMSELSVHIQNIQIRAIITHCVLYMYTQLRHDDITKKNDFSLLRHFVVAQQTEIIFFFG